MAQKYLSFGYDTERPYGELALSERGSAIRKKQIDFVRNLNSMFDQKCAPRTFFILGHYLESCLNEYDMDSLREVYDITNPLVEIQQHSYSHQIFRPIKGRNDKQILTPKEFAEDLKRAGVTIKKILGIYPDGLRTPLGYHHNLSDMPEILEVLRRMEFRYVSSNLRSEESLEAPLNKNTQPHDYGMVGYPTIMEIPSNGWQDVVFTQEKAMLFLGREPDSPEKIFQHYNELLKKAIEWDTPMVSIALCLHPWAVMDYDPQLEIHKRIIDSARNKGFEIRTYGQVADSFRPLTPQAISVE